MDGDFYRMKEKPHPQENPDVDCGCICCDQYRAERIKVGDMCRPFFQKKSQPGTTPYWYPGTWKTSGWSLRMQRDRIERVVVIGFPRGGDDDHLDPVLCYAPGVGEIVTSRRWLNVISAKEE
jgi:hypothetical protein